MLRRSQGWFDKIRVQESEEERQQREQNGETSALQRRVLNSVTVMNVKRFMGELGDQLL
jgi:hypothetical protein